MLKSLTMVLAGVILAGCSAGARAARDDAAQPSASVGMPSEAVSPVGVWRGTASEVASIYTGPASATVTLDVRPDGTYTQVWSEKGQERSETGRWHARDGRILFDGQQPNVNRTLRYTGDALFGVSAERLPAQGRVGTEAISLRRVI